VKKWLRRADSEIYHVGIHALVPRWCKTVKRDGDYIEE
jgi:hypothetical protein